MELNILSKAGYELEVELKGETHTILNLIKDFLTRDSRVEAAFYDMKHVSISDPILYIKTDGTDPIEVLKDATSIIIAQCNEFIDVFSKAVNA